MSVFGIVAELHGDLLARYPHDLTVRDVIEQQAEVLFAEHQRGNTAVCIQISNWLPALAGVKEAAIMEADFNLADAELTVAREHGFRSRLAIVDTPIDVEFETAVTAVTTGDLDQLQMLLEQSPDLVDRRSVFGHKATLLHYVVANGVETWRQQVPANAVAITQYLLDMGANKKARMSVYGGQHHPFSLLVTSAHPAKMGLTDELALLLRV